MKYILEISEKQAEIIKGALEEYFRLRMNQWFDFANDLAFNGFDYNKSHYRADAEYERKFTEVIDRRDEAEELFQKACRTAHPMHSMKTDEMLIAQDIWQVIRHKLFLERGGDPNDWCVDARKPMKMSDEELPVMKGAKK